MRKVLLLTLLCACLAGCASRYTVVEIPPRVDLQDFATIGIVQFSSNSTQELNRAATEEFIRNVQKAQPGVRFLELGSEQELLGSVRHDSMNPAAIQEIGRKYGVDSLFVGHFDVSEVKPRVRLSRDLSSVSASGSVNASMVSKHVDTSSGATIWTEARDGKWEVASLSKKAGTPIAIDMSNPEDRYGEFVVELAHAVTEDFRAHYQKRKVH